MINIWERKISLNNGFKAFKEEGSQKIKKGKGGTTFSLFVLQGFKMDVCNPNTLFKFYQHLKFYHKQKNLHI